MCICTYVMLRKHTFLVRKHTYLTRALSKYTCIEKVFVNTQGPCKVPSQALDKKP